MKRIRGNPRRDLIYTSFHSIAGKNRLGATGEAKAVKATRRRFRGSECRSSSSSRVQDSRVRTVGRAGPAAGVYEKAGAAGQAGDGCGVRGL